jgi:hypothetical protein
MLLHWQVIACLMGDKQKVQLETDSMSIDRHFSKNMSIDAQRWSVSVCTRLQSVSAHLQRVSASFFVFLGEVQAAYVSFPIFFNPDRREMADLTIKRKKKKKKWQTKQR